MKNKLRQSIHEHAYNEEKILINIIMTARSEGLKPSMRCVSYRKDFLRFGITFTLVCLLGLVSLSQVGIFNFYDNNKITTIYALDINPSFEISVNKFDKVVSIDAINSDAKSIEVLDLYGKDASYVIEELIQKSTFAGFIKSNDLIDDYVVITAIPMTKDEDQSNEIEDKLEQRIKASIFLQSLNVAVIKSSLRDLKTAQEKKIPIGLYIINGMIGLPNGMYLSAKDFFSNPQYRAIFQVKGEIKAIKVNRLKALILDALEKLEAIGIDTSDYKKRLISASTQERNMIQNEVRKLLSSNNIGS